jgi:pyruvate,water dikinase
MKRSEWVNWFAELPADAVSIAGGKGACLARIRSAGLPAPPGFVVCAAAFREFLNSEGYELVRGATARLDANDHGALNAAAETVRGFILSRAIPRELAETVGAAYTRMGGVPVAVRSSAIGEDGAAASFAGQQETFLNITGADAVIGRVKECWASFFTPRAMFYRACKGTLADSDIAVVVQEMAVGEKSGVMFTVDPVSKRRDRMVIEAARGLGDALVSGEITPDHYVVGREDAAVLAAFSPDGGEGALGERELRELVAMGTRLEKLFGGPQDVEWLIRGEELLLLQSRPITTL